MILNAETISQTTPEQWKEIAQRHAWMYKSFSRKENKMREAFDAASAYFAYLIAKEGNKIEGQYSDLGDLFVLADRAMKTNTADAVADEWNAILNTISQWRYVDHPQPYAGYDAETNIAVGDKAIWLIENAMS